MKKLIQEHPEFRKLVWLFYFLVKVVFFTGIFTILRIFLLDEEQQRWPTGDLEGAWEIPEIEEQWTRDSSISSNQAQQTLQEIFQWTLQWVDNNTDRNGAGGSDNTRSSFNGDNTNWNSASRNNAGSAPESDHQSASQQGVPVWSSKVPTTQSPSIAQQRLKKICSFYTDICNKTLREGEFSLDERLFYQGVLIYLITRIDDTYQASGWVHSAPSESQTSWREIVSYLKVHQDPEARRWSAWHTFFKVNEWRMRSRNEFWQVATHEYWHIFDLGVLKGSSSLIDKTFTEFWKPQRAMDDPSLRFYKISRESENARKASASRMDFVSWYAMKWVYEDFAESFNLYMNHRDYFKTLASQNAVLQEKFTFFEEYFPEWLFNEWISTDLPRLTTRVWDTTRIWN